MMVVNQVGRVRAYETVSGGENAREQKKQMPDRWPANHDSIGIELVEDAIEVEGSEYPVYETVTAEQNASLKWLVLELRLELQVPMTEVFRHPTVTRKTETEAETAKW